jgi:hypothetical protein
MRSLENCSEASRGSCANEAKRHQGDSKAMNWIGRTYQSRKMIDSDNGHPGVTLTDINLDSRLGEGGVDGRVDRDRVVGVGSAAATFV